MGCLIHWILVLYEIVLFARVLSSWFPMPISGPGRTVMSALHAVTEPVLRPLRALLPPLRTGSIGFDLSPIIVFLVLAILIRGINC
jgi:YggT family protein